MCLQLNDLVAKAEWCRRYAQINSVGLRKVCPSSDDSNHTCGIGRVVHTSNAYLHHRLLNYFVFPVQIVKKHDKICKNKAGHIYMQVRRSLVE